MSVTNYTRLPAHTNRNKENSHGIRLSSESDYQATYAYRQVQPPLRQNLRHYNQDTIGLNPISPNIPATITDRSTKESVIVKKINPTRAKKPVVAERNSHIIRGRGVIFSHKDHNSFIDKENRMSILDGGKRHSFGGVIRTSFIESNTTVNAEESTRSSFVTKEAVARKNTVDCLARETRQSSEMARKASRVEIEKLVVKNIAVKEKCVDNVSEYAPVIMETLKMKDREATPVYCLRSHKIPSSLRAKMVDWMVEVLTSYKCSEQTFFVAVNTMDMFLQKTKTPQEVADLHLIGVTSMFMASKYEDIYALRLNVICEKIAHKKLTPDQIRHKEMEILSALEYKMTNVTLYEFITNALYQMNIKEKLSPKLYEYLHKVCVYLAKAVVHDYEIINQQDCSTLAGAIISVAFKVVSKLEKNLPVDQLVIQLIDVLKLTGASLTECAGRALSFTRNFDKLYPNLSNLRKFNNLNYDENSNGAENTGITDKKGKN